MGNRLVLSAPVCLLLLLVSITTPTWATTNQHFTGKELVAAADLVVVGRCASATSRWQGRALVTDVTVKIDDTLFGRSEHSITVTLPGGIDRSRAVPIAVTVPNAPSLVPGEDFLLFLDRLPDGSYTVVGLNQGAFPVLQSEGQAMVSRSRHQVRDGLPLQQVKQWIAHQDTTDRR